MPAWLKALALLPLPVLYGLTGFLVFLAHRVLRFKLSVARRNVAASFPDLAPREQRRIVAGHYRQMGQIAAEVIHGAVISEQELARRVQVRNLGLPRELLSQGRSLLLVGAHLANWEWVLPAISTRLGFPLDVAYKPIHSHWAEQAFRALRGRFGAHLVHAKALLPDLLQRRGIVRGIALLADQSPRTSEHQHWDSFLGRETSFYVGPEQVSRSMRYPAVFVAMRRLRRGHYEIEFLPLAGPGESLAPGEFTTRYVRLLEAEIRAAPADWTWGHNRWKLQRTA